MRLVQADLNFVQLPEGKYDVVWTSACLHHLTNLEHLFQEIERSLRPGGLFAINDYVGERRLCYDPERIRLADAIYRQVPARYRTVGVERVQPPPEADKSPFEALRSDEILPLARERFDQLHLGLTGALHPLFFLLDTALMEREEAQWVERVLVAEEEAVRTPGIRACTAYAVFRKRR